MTEYVKEHSIGELLRNAASIYFRNLGSIAGPYLILTLPANLVQWRATLDGNTSLAWMAVVAALPFALVAYGALVVSVSEACLGTNPKASRSLRYVFSGGLGRLIAASLLQLLAIAVGFVFLIVPGLVAIVLLAFTPIAVTLEGAGPVAALKRSQSLASGHHWRTAGVMVLMTIVLMVVGGIAGGILGGLMVSLEVYTLALLLLMLLLQPIAIVLLVLIYYDLRVRKEGYNMAALEQDLAR